MIRSQVGSLLSPAVQRIRVSATHPLQVTRSVDVGVCVVALSAGEVIEILLIWLGFVLQIISVNAVRI